MMLFIRDLIAKETCNLKIINKFNSIDLLSRYNMITNYVIIILKAIGTP